MVDTTISTVCGGESGADGISSLNDTKDSNFILEHEKFSSLQSIQDTDPSLRERVKGAFVKVKEEVDYIEEDDIDVSEIFCDESCNELSSPLSSSSCVKPMEGLHETGLPPFLKKIFEIVEDPETESIVSWSKNGESFVVWDSHEFSKTLLPKYFKHSNFSSFIRQLNTYGFRKIDSDRWEFANEGFKGGKRHLLKNIKRRSRYNKRHEQGGVSNISSIDSLKPKLEAQLENLKSDQDFLRVEIHKLRHQQEDSLNQMSAVEERVRAAECKQLQMFIFISKVTRNPSYIQQLLLKKKRQGSLEGGEFLKKRRLLQTKLPENSPDDLGNNHSVEFRNQAQEQLATMQNELAETLPDGSKSSSIFEVPMTDEFSTSIHDDAANMMCGTEPQELPSSGYNLISDDLFDDNSAVSNSGNEGSLDVNDTKFYLELEDLIRKKPKPWSGSYVSELVEQASCI